MSRKGLSLRSSAAVHALGLILGGGVAVADETAAFGGFLEKYCYECHGAEKQKGEVRLDTFGSDLGDEAVLGRWQDVLEQVRSGEMPPAKRAQPNAAERAGFVERLTATLAGAYGESHADVVPVVRRLNRT